MILVMENLEIICDASLRTMPKSNRVFTCSGALCINTGDEDYIISPDSTNNRGELLAIYLGCKLALRIRNTEPERYSQISIYSDSQFAIFGLTRWMHDWLKTMNSQGVMYGTNGLPVKNQELFKMIITFCTINRLEVHFYNQRGHTKLNSTANLARANQQFFKANGFFLKPEDIYKISFYNGIIDRNTRNKLYEIDESNYSQLFNHPNAKPILRYVIPENYKNYIR